MNLFSKLFGKKKKHHHSAAPVSKPCDSQSDCEICDDCKPGGCETCDCPDSVECGRSDSLEHECDAD